jgi:sugar/nucleoside kinase (ribokinase family)
LTIYATLIRLAVMSARINIGCSFNSEVVAILTDLSVEKGVLPGFDVAFSGSSANVANASRACGSSVGLFGLVGPNSLRTDLLKLAAKWAKFPLPTLLDVLTDTSVAVIPYDLKSSRTTVAGAKGEIVQAKVNSALRKLKRFLDINPNAFGVMTGFRKEELPFANAVYNRTPAGKRVLCPRVAFCRDASFEAFLLGVDCLVVNEEEFYAAGGNAQNLIDLGPRVVVVTKGRAGGECYVRGERVVVYEPHIVTQREATGTGDWFLGSFISYLDIAGETFLTATSDMIRRAVTFAARVAGHKATIPGGSKGPSEELIRQLLR